MATNAEKKTEKTEKPLADADSTTPPPPAAERYYQQAPKKKNWDLGRVIWGLLLVLVGGLLLVENLGLIDIQWNNLWRLWPLAIIAAGLSTLSVGNWMWRVLSALLVVVIFAVIIFVAVGNYSDPRPVSSHETTVQRISDDIKQAEVTVKAGASSLQIASADQDAVAKAKLDSSTASLTEVTTRNGDKQLVTLSTADGRWIGNAKNSLSVDLTRNLPLRLYVDVGASDAQIDMSQAQLSVLSVKTGASSLVVKLGDRMDTTDVTIESGVSSIVLRIPSGSGVKLKLDSKLSAKQLADLRETTEGTFESPNYGQAAKKITIVGDVGVGSFTIERY